MEMTLCWVCEYLFEGEKKGKQGLVLSFDKKFITHFLPKRINFHENDCSI